MSPLALDGTPRRTFVDRHSAGVSLARAAKRLRLPPETIVLGLPRGGVPVAFEVAKALRVPLDVLVVRKIGMPANPELAIGAIASGAYLSAIGEWYDDFRQIEDEEVCALLERAPGEHDDH